MYLFFLLTLFTAFPGAKLKRERTEQDDLFCEEKMLIIDGKFVEKRNMYSSPRVTDHALDLVTDQLRLSPNLGIGTIATALSCVKHNTRYRKQAI